MSPQVPQSPVYIVRRRADDDVYDADVYEPDEHHGDDQLLETLLQQIMHMWRNDRSPSSKQATPPPRAMPTGLGSSQDDQPNPESYGVNRRRAPRLPYFLAVGQTSQGSLAMIFHLPRKIVFAFFIVMFLIVIGISQVPALGDLLFSFL